jgi:hypothetical protein
VLSKETNFRSMEILVFVMLAAAACAANDSKPVCDSR